MKTLKQTSFAVLSLMLIPIGTNAAILSSLDYTPSQMLTQCAKSNINIQKCQGCFLLIDKVEYRLTGEIRYDTSTETCEEVENGYTWEVYTSWDECNSWMVGELLDHCAYCLQGAHNEILQIDGPDTGDILFLVRENEYNDYSFDCIISDNRTLACGNGYYGYPDSYDQDKQDWYGCYKCPMDGVANNMPYGKRTSITDCYIPKNQEVKDSTGTFEFTSDCYYAK